MNGWAKEKVVRILDSNTGRVLLRRAESAGPQIALTHANAPAVFGILRAAKVKVLQTANPHLGRAAALGGKGFASTLGHQGCWLDLGVQDQGCVIDKSDKSFCACVLKMLIYRNVEPNIAKLPCIQIRFQNTLHITHPGNQNVQSS